MEPKIPSKIIITKEHNTQLHLLNVNNNKINEKMFKLDDPELRGIVIYFNDDGHLSHIHFSDPQCVVIDRPSIRFDRESSMVYVSLRKGARHEKTVEIEEFDDEIMFDFDSNDQVFGFAVCNVEKYFMSEFLQLLTNDRAVIPVQGLENSIAKPAKQHNKLQHPPQFQTQPSKKPFERPQVLVSVCQGDLNAVQEYYSKDKNILNITDYKGSNIITLSAAFGHLNILIWATNQGSSLKSSRNDGATPFIQAALHGHLHIMTWLLEKDKSILDEVDVSGDSALMHAASGGHLDIVKWLIENNADVGKKSKSGSNALHRAATSGHFDIVKYLIMTKAVSIDDKTARGGTALHYAARNRNTDIVKYLVEEGANIDINDTRGDNLERIVHNTDNADLTDWLFNWRRKHF